MAVTAAPARPASELRDRLVRRAEVVGVWAVDCVRTHRTDTDWAAELLGDSEHRLEHATLEGDGYHVDSFGVQRVLSAPGVRGSAPALATERSGEVVAAWSEAGPVGPAATWWISTTVRPGATSDFPPGRRLAGADGAYRPSALLGADATTQILWRVGDGPLLSARRAG